MSNVIHRTDEPSLTFGHDESSVTELSIVGLHLTVYGLKEIEKSDRPLAVLVAAHGRTNSQKNMITFSHGILGKVNSKDDRERKRDLIIVTLDQRNHGGRITDRKANLSYDENPRHLIDMAAKVSGGAQDVQLIIDFLAAYLFPLGQKTIDEWIITGISLGGHVAWRLLREEPRIKIGIPIIGLPFESFPKYMRPRAEAMGIPFVPPTYPPSLIPFLEDDVDHHKYKGKKILTIHGGHDKLVPLDKGQADIDAVLKVVNESGGKGEIWVDENTGHAVSKEMVEKTAEWVWEYGLRK
ncbi:uncharacterized protein I303_106429 [Kwoniella dejecticola CBS 10117]|uniref:Peptidase S9 prolyl oligopeptidase catalytic domain-containing protein n=1 Tax=Kwoniella dejecticola CBS 10117 TaxID=1296121 RepID=A0A1A5ZUQ8_9TREE|nr:uncharacterized protein I303_08312 [Kwoniella dejecticola CBS 10117]OBR81542.1 hypothetical protein I303_08312 [Kwoniella dejecticola CBS 10117]